jgi:hypothetical protein
VGALVLGDLVSDGASLSAGPHELLAVLVSDEGRVLRDPAGEPGFLIVSFFVGEKGTLKAAESARLFCLSPFGTHYASAGAPLRLEVLALGPGSGPIPLTTTAGSRRWQQALEPNRAFALADPPLGDLSFHAGAEVGPHADCLVTVNPVAEAPGR